MTLKTFGKRNQPETIAGGLSGSAGKASGGKSGKRNRPRIETWSACTIFWPPDGRLKGICVDVSESGARVKFSENLRIPSHVRLVSAQLGLNREAMLVRIDGLDAAFRFLE